MSHVDDAPWYAGITSYQWLVLLIASLGWIFDVFEGQIFVASMRDAMPNLLDVVADDPAVRRWNDWAFGSFLLGGALGGVLFGMVSDRIGRSKTMIVTILFYSVFTCVTAFAQAPWHMVILRFFVAMGVGGEWAVASAMVAEVMPTRSRPIMSSIFHGSSVFGTLLAAAAGAYVVGNPALGSSAWRWGFAIGVLPALLTIWVRWKLREPEKWVKARELADQADQPDSGRILELFHGPNLRNTIVGVSLSSIGLVTFWGGHIYGKNALLRDAETKALQTENVELSPPTNESHRTSYQGARKAALTKHRTSIKRAEMLSMVLNSIGGGLGLVLFGTISNRIGRKGAFIFYHIAAFVMMLLLFKVLIAHGVAAIWLALTLPLFGFFTVGLHAGYAVYFPELYPTRLRGTGAGFCFNMGRLATAAAFFGFGALAATEQYKDYVIPENKALILAPLFLLGAAIVFAARETRGEDLPD